MSKKRYEAAKGTVARLRQAQQEMTREAPL